MRNALVLLALACGLAHAAPKIEMSPGVTGDVCRAQRGAGDTKDISLTVQVAADGRVVGFETPVRITDATVVAINATLRACVWAPSKSERRIPVRVWVPSGWLF